MICNTQLNLVHIKLMNGVFLKELLICNHLMGYMVEKLFLKFFTIILLQ